MNPLTKPQSRRLAPGKLLINGEWREAFSGKRTPCTDPSTEEVITDVASGAPVNVDVAVGAARRAFDDGPWIRMHHEERAKIMFRMADLLPLDPATQIGPIATRREFDKVNQYIAVGRESGARLVAGGGTRRLNGKGLFIEPTLFADATNDMRISREEIFGPVLPIIPFENEDDAVRIANDTPYGLTSGIQTGSVARGIRLADRIRAGTVWLNTWHKYHPNAPFGGFKMSGHGREQGAEALESYSQYKSIWLNVA